MHTLERWDGQGIYAAAAVIRSAAGLVCDPEAGRPFGSEAEGGCPHICLPRFVEYPVYPSC